jgi:hypothetical protein
VSGSNRSKFIIRSISANVHALRVSCRPRILHRRLKLKFLSMNWAPSEGRRSISFADGMPIHLRISYSWSTVLLPRKRGARRTNSARTQPALHISIDSLQVVIPRSPSGGLYHLDATYSVKTPSQTPSPSTFSLAIPKSQILSSNLAQLRRRLEGLMSLWTRPDRCRYASPWRSW